MSTMLMNKHQSVKPVFSLVHLTLVNLVLTSVHDKPSILRMMVPGMVNASNVTCMTWKLRQGFGKWTHLGRGAGCATAGAAFWPWGLAKTNDQ